MKKNNNIPNMIDESHIIECERFFRELFVHTLLIFFVRHSLYAWYTFFEFKVSF